MDHCKVIAITNQKGGVGKTTTTVNLGVGLAKTGHRVLLIDADPQGSLTISLGIKDPDSLNESLATVMTASIEDIELPPETGIIHNNEGIDLMPSNIELSGVETGLFNTMSREFVLRNYISTVKKNYDYILIDCMPSLGMMTINALVAADSVIIPSQPNFLSTKGLNLLLRSVSKVKRSMTHDKVETTGSHAAWKEVLAVYSVSLTTDGENPQEAASMTNEKKDLLTDIFWTMHTINYGTELRIETEYWESVDENGELITEENEVVYNYLLIRVDHKTASEMAEHYGFTDDQKERLNELLLPENQTMWNDVLYGLGGQGDLVAVALSQVGNVGGETYWRWYGFDERVDWCAIFVSWCANECGYLENCVIPSFAVCYAGEDWFKAREQWHDNTYTPNPGDIIFFDWDYPDEGGQDGIPNHVGIVEKVEDGIVYTIEGNSGDSCRQKSYPVGYYEIHGFGVLCP
ncbi:MAG: CHAP domain-containing protein [Ruminococcaceae bacterium]|nr:CHAP domain-containing protein [Oscillospiraceae bacterium]